MSNELRDAYKKAFSEQAKFKQQFHEQLDAALEDARVWGFERGYTISTNAEWRALVEKLVAALRQYKTGVDCESKVMQAWDKGSGLIRSGDITSDMPRMVFEMELEAIEEIADEALAEAKLRGVGV